MLSKTTLSKIPKLRSFSTSNVKLQNHRCRILIVGGGSGGCTVAAKLEKHVKNEEMIILEPSDTHYYQPMFTLVGGGIKTLQNTAKPMRDVLPKKAKWLQDKVARFVPEENRIVTGNGDEISYDFILIAVGLQLNYQEIPGLVEALEDPNSGVCSNYSPKYVEKTFKVLENFQSGNAIFTFPSSPVKCPGAPQKICYLTEHYLRKHGKRDKANIIYNTSLPVIFGVKRYAEALWKIVKERNITVNLRTNLIQVEPKENVAVFQNLDDEHIKTRTEYSMLHVTPPMGPPNVLKGCKELVNEAGFLSLNKSTLQHVKYPNIFGIGDCTSTPNSKTGASVAAQSKTVFENLKAAMENKPLKSKYTGYASCPLITGYGKCILAEFDYDLKPTETFPINQDKEMWTMYAMKKDIMPTLYWQLMLKGHWDGPEMLRKIMHLGFV